MERIVVDEASGTAGVTMITTAAGDGFITSNAEYGEYALYTARA